jgi:sigma-B regulation protein RsbQ
MHRKIPDNQLALIDAPGHCPHMSHPEETIARMADFVGLKQGGGGH